MKDEIDLSPYITTLFNYWQWIVGSTVGLAVLAFIVSLVIPQTYEAVTIVAATTSRYQLQFDARFQNVADSNLQAVLLNQYRSYPILAMSDDLLQQIANKMGREMKDLQRDLKATNDFNLVTLTVADKNAEESAKTANFWAEIFVKKVNALYKGDNEVERLRKQKADATQVLEQSDAAITAFRKENGLGDGAGLGFLGQQLQVKKNLLIDYQIELARVNRMRREVELLSANPVSSPTLIAGLLAEMINNGILRDNPPHQIKLDAVDPITALAAMKVALDARATVLESAAKSLPTEIATLQTELALKQAQLEQLNRERQLRTETYVTLSRKLQELELLDPTGVGQVQVASQAAVPTEPVSPKKAITALIGAALGFLASTCYILIWSWRRDAQV